jgi:hypothetical protein
MFPSWSYGDSVKFDGNAPNDDVLNAVGGESVKDC